MVKIFFFQGKYGHGEEGWPLIKRCASSLLGFAPDIKVSKNGKPYFARLPKGINLQFSLSNTGDVWGIAFSDYLCGFDAQEERESRWEAVSEKEFTKEENAYVKKKGIEGFYRIWTRKEALGKLTEEGIYRTLSGKKSLVNKKGELKKYILTKEGRVYFYDFYYEASKRICCSFCSKSGNEKIEIVD